MSVKEAIYQHCVDFVTARVTLFGDAIREAQSGANNETKSSAGDKHETGRAMAQLETEKNTQHLIEAKKLRAVLSQINPQETHEVIRLGSLVETSAGYYYIAISAGKIELDGQVFYAISPTSPIGNLLLGETKNGSIVFNNRAIQIKSIQ